MGRTRAKANSSPEHEATEVPHPDERTVQEWLAIDGVKSDWKHHIRLAEYFGIPVDGLHTDIACFLETLGLDGDRAGIETLLLLRGVLPSDRTNLQQLLVLLQSELNRLPTANVRSVELKPLVELRGQTERPLVCGEEVERLSEPRYAVIKALLDAGKDGMSKADLAGVKGDAVKYLRGLRKQSELWNRAIRMAGKAWGRYAIAWG